MRLIKEENKYPDSFLSFLKIFSFSFFFRNCNIKICLPRVTFPITFLFLAVFIIKIRKIKDGTRLQHTFPSLSMLLKKKQVLVYPHILTLIGTNQIKEKC